MTGKIVAASVALSVLLAIFLPALLTSVALGLTLFRGGVEPAVPILFCCALPVTALTGLFTLRRFNALRSLLRRPDDGSVYL